AISSGTRMYSRSCSTRSTISIMRRPASFRQKATATSSISTLRWPIGSIMILPKSALAASSSNRSWRGGARGSLTRSPALPGDVKTEILDIDLKTRGGRTVPVRLFHKVAFGPDGTPGSSRTLVINRARDGSIDSQRAAEVRFVRFFQNTPMAIATVDKQGRIVDSNARFARLLHPVFKGEAWKDRSILSVVAERDRGVLEAAIRTAADGQSEIDPVEATLEGAGERYASFFVTAVEDEKQRDREAAIVYALETTQQRTLENQVNQQQKMETIGRLAGNI